MGNCLVTKLKGVVNNDNLEPLGGMYIWFDHVDNPTAQTQKMRIIMREVTTLVAVEGYFTDSTLSENLGTTKEVDSNTSVDIYVSNGAKILIPNKYSINVIDVSEGEYPTDNKNKRFDIENLAYCTDPYCIGYVSRTSVFGDISKVKWLGSQTPKYQYFNQTDIYGDISDCAWLLDCAHLNIASSQIKMNIAKLSQGIFVDTWLNDSGVYGVLPENFASPRLRILNLYNIDEVSGDVKNLPVSTKLQSINITNSPNLQGNIADFAERLIQAGWSPETSGVSYLGINNDTII